MQRTELSTVRDQEDKNSGSFIQKSHNHCSVLTLMMASTECKHAVTLLRVMCTHRY